MLVLLIDSVVLHCLCVVVAWRCASLWILCALLIWFVVIHYIELGTGFSYVVYSQCCLAMMLVYLTLCCVYITHTQSGGTGNLICIFTETILSSCSFIQTSAQLQASIHEFTHQALDYSYQVNPSLSLMLSYIYVCVLSVPCYKLCIFYCLQLNLVECQKGPEILDKVVSYVHIQCSIMSLFMI